MSNLASLLQNNAGEQIGTYTNSKVLSASVPELFAIPTDADGKNAAYIMFGAPIGTDFFALEGLETVTNGTFATDTGWTKGTGWTIGSGVATATGAISTSLEQESNALIVGQSYLVTITTTRSAGSITPNVGGTAGTARSTGATFTEIIVAGASKTIEFTTSGFTGTLDNVTIVPTAIVPGDTTNGLTGPQNPKGFALNTNSEYVSVVSAGTPIITASFYRG